MELRQLKYFAEAASTLNFTESARNLNITQSTLSQQIKQLEEEFNILLFDRIGKKIVLTEAGESFLPYARKTLTDAETGKQKLMDLKKIESGKLKLGITYSLSSLLTSVLLLFTKRYPNIDIEIVYCSSYDLLELLRTHEVDCILSLQQNIKNDNFNYTFLFESKLSVVVNKNHYLAALKSISINKLQNTPLALLSKDFTARNIFDTIAQNKNIKIKPALELNEVNILLQFVKSGRWATVLSQITVAGKPELKAIPINVSGCNMNAVLITLKDVYVKNSLKAFREMLLERINNKKETV